MKQIPLPNLDILTPPTSTTPTVTNQSARDECDHALRDQPAKRLAPRHRETHCASPPLSVLSLPLKPPIASLRTIPVHSISVPESPTEPAPESWDANANAQPDRSTRTPDSNQSNQRREITSLFDLVGLGTSIATSLTVGVCGYYAHELIDPEVDVALLPDIPTELPADDGSSPKMRTDSLADIPRNVSIAAPEFLTSLRREARQWGSDLRRFTQALQTPRPTPTLAMANRDLTPQYPANPTIERWLDQTTGVQSDPSGKHQIYLAKKQAMAGQFVAAIVELEKISATSPHFDLAQTKLAEYSQKRDVRARVSLQTAYNLAAAGDFGGALAFLNEIPSESTIYATVQQKRLEYTQKRDLQAKTWLYHAKNLAAETQHEDAIAILRMIPQGTAVYGEAKHKIIEYHQILAIIKQQRLEQQRLEQQRLEQQRLEQQRLEQQRLEQQRLEQERLKQVRAKQPT